jgi:hypothetical protein
VRRHAGAGVADLDHHVGAVGRAVIRSVPAPSIASTALSMRLVHTWFSSPAYASIRGASAAYSRTIVTPSPSRLRSITSVLSMPSVISTCWIEARSICAYDRTAATRSQTRRIDSLVSATTAVTDNALATHSSPGERRPRQHRAARSHQATSTPAAASARRDDPVALDAVPAEPVGKLVLQVGGGDGAQLDNRRLDLAAQRVERGELRRRQVAAGEAADRREQRAAGVLECVDAAGRRPPPDC